MDTNPFENLNFDTAPKLRLSPRSLFLMIVMTIYAIAFWAVPAATLFWLGLPVVLGLAWAASFGWRQAVRHISQLFQRLERF